MTEETDENCSNPVCAGGVVNGMPPYPCPVCGGTGKKKKETKT